MPLEQSIDKINKLLNTNSDSDLLETLDTLYSEISQLDPKKDLSSKTIDKIRKVNYRVIAWQADTLTAIANEKMQAFKAEVEGSTDQNYDPSKFKSTKDIAEYTDGLARLVEQQIVAEKNLIKRTLLIEFYINLAWKLTKRNDYLSGAGIFQAFLFPTTVERLLVEDTLSNRAKEKLAQLRGIYPTDVVSREKMAELETRVAAIKKPKMRNSVINIDMDYAQAGGKLESNFLGVTLPAQERIAKLTAQETRTPEEEAERKKLEQTISTNKNADSEQRKKIRERAINQIQTSFIPFEITRPIWGKLKERLGEVTQLVRDLKAAESFKKKINDLQDKNNSLLTNLDTNFNQAVRDQIKKLTRELVDVYLKFNSRAQAEVLSKMGFSLLSKEEIRTILSSIKNDLAKFQNQLQSRNDETFTSYGIKKANEASAIRPRGATLVKAPLLKKYPNLTSPLNAKRMKVELEPIKAITDTVSQLTQLVSNQNNQFNEKLTKLLSDAQKEENPYKKLEMLDSLAQDENFNKNIAASGKSPLLHSMRRTALRQVSEELAELARYQFLQFNDFTNIETEFYKLQRPFQVNASEFNFLSAYVQQTILEKEDIKERTLALERWVGILENCLELNDRHTAFAIYMGLEAHPIHRLKGTYAGLSDNAKQVLEIMKKISTGNPETQYTMMTANKNQLIPFHGFYKSKLINAKGSGDETTFSQLIKELTDLQANMKVKFTGFKGMSPLQQFVYVNALNQMQKTANEEYASLFKKAKDATNELKKSVTYPQLLKDVPPFESLNDITNFLSSIENVAGALPEDKLASLNTIKKLINHAKELNEVQASIKEEISSYKTTPIDINPEVLSANSNKYEQPNTKVRATNLLQQKESPLSVPDAIHAKLTTVSLPEIANVVYTGLTIKKTLDGMAAKVEEILKDKLAPDPLLKLAVEMQIFCKEAHELTRTINHELKNRTPNSLNTISRSLATLEVLSEQLNEKYAKLIKSEAFKAEDLKKSADLKKKDPAAAVRYDTHIEQVATQLQQMSTLLASFTSVKANFAKLDHSLPPIPTPPAPAGATPKNVAPPQPQPVSTTPAITLESLQKKAADSVAAHDFTVIENILADKTQRDLFIANPSALEKLKDQYQRILHYENSALTVNTLKATVNTLNNTVVVKAEMDKISNYIIDDILKLTNIDNRTLRVERYIALMTEAYSNSDFLTVSAIYNALKSPEISSLHKTLAGLADHTQTRLSSIDAEIQRTLKPRDNRVTESDVLLMMANARQSKAMFYKTESPLLKAIASHQPANRNQLTDQLDEKTNPALSPSTIMKQDEVKKFIVSYEQIRQMKINLDDYPIRLRRENESMAKSIPQLQQMSLMAGNMFNHMREISEQLETISMRLR